VEVVLIDSGGANIGSVQYALERLGARSRLTSDAETIAKAERVILPGVGAAGAGMARLRELGLVEVIRGLSQPLLGICLGMQLLFESSEENEATCLGLIPGRVRKLSEGAGIRVPHMGWNTLQPERDDPLLAGMASGAQAYFVHSYAVPLGDYTLASATHGEGFSAMVRRGRCWGAQFHPERSAAVGARLLENFLSERLA
jgi:glutamine amidotransferase